MSYVLDTTAVITLLDDRPGADQVQAVMEGEEDVFLPFITLMEVRYVLMRQYPPERVAELIEIIRATAVKIEESTPEWGVRAALVKSRGGLSLADSWIAALALLRDATLLHHDPEYDQVKGLKALRLR
ncbi:MAG: PIN domain-containing protein [Dehalococcoidia bacterium]